MTIENEKNENTENMDQDDTAVSNDAAAVSKTERIAEKLKGMGVMSSENNSSENSARRFSPMLITFSLAIPAGLLVAYMTMPEQLDQLWSSVMPSSDTAQSQQMNQISNTSPYPQMPAAGPAAYWNQPAGSSEWQRPAEPEWVSQQRAEMEKRRKEYQQKYVDSYASNWTQPQPPEPPQWVKDRQAEMEKEMAQYSSRSYPAVNGTSQPPEPPQWVKDRQAEMEKEMAQYSSQPYPAVNGPYNDFNQKPEYMKHPAENPYQANVAQQAPAAQPPQFVQQPPVYQQRQLPPPAYNYPANYPRYYGSQYAYNPYYRPYGWYAYPWR